MYYSDESSGSENNDTSHEVGFPMHMLSPKEEIMVSQHLDDVKVSKMHSSTCTVRYNTTSPLQDKYSDMDSEEEDSMAMYSDMDDIEDSDEFDSEMDYSRVFPIDEYEQRNEHVVMMNTRLEKEKNDLIGGRNKDYLGLARDYKIHRKYSDPRRNLSCVLCHNQTAIDVFFPCEHSVCV